MPIGMAARSWKFHLVDDYIDIGKGVGLWSSLQVDGDVNVHIAYMDEKYDNLKYAFKNHASGDWTEVTCGWRQRERGLDVFSGARQLE